MDEHHEGITFAWHVLLSFQEVGNQLWRIRDQEVKVPGRHKWSLSVWDHERKLWGGKTSAPYAWSRPVQDQQQQLPERNKPCSLEPHCNNHFISWREKQQKLTHIQNTLCPSSESLSYPYNPELCMLTSMHGTIMQIKYNHAKSSCEAPRNGFISFQTTHLMITSTQTKIISKNNNTGYTFPWWLQITIC